MQTSMRPPLSLRPQACRTQRKGQTRPMLTAVPGVWAQAQKLRVGLQRLMKRVVWFMAMVTTVAAILAEAEAPQVRQGRQGRQREREGVRRRA